MTTTAFFTVSTAASALMAALHTASGVALSVAGYGAVASGLGYAPAIVSFFLVASELLKCGF